MLTIADELTAQFQRIEEAWRAAENKLAATRVPCDVRIKVGTKKRKSGDVPTYLAYCRFRNCGRRICLVQVDYEHCEANDNAKPVDEFPVDIRLQMFDHFPALLAEAHAVAQCELLAIKERVARFEETLAAIE